MNTFEFIKQVVQYDRLTENRQYLHTSSEIIIMKLKLCQKVINNNTVSTITQTGVTPTCP